MSVMQRSQLRRYVLQAAGARPVRALAGGQPLALIDATPRSIGDSCFQNVPLLSAAVRAPRCSVTARR
jgi:hypothetical protein